MGNSQSEVLVINKENQRLKVRVDCHRMVTNLKVSVSGLGIKISNSQNESMFYVVDTSDAFTMINPNSDRSYLVEGKVCYITASDENNVPLFINHGIPSNCVVTIKNGLPHISDKEGSSWMSRISNVRQHDQRAVYVRNKSTFDIRARADCDEGICAIDYSIATKGYEFKLSHSQSAGYKVDKQGYTTLKPGQETIFYLNVAGKEDDTCFITLQYVNNNSEIIDICKNHRARMHETDTSESTFLTRRIYNTGPVFTVENDPNYGSNFKQQRFRYTIRVGEDSDVFIKWEIFG